MPTPDKADLIEQMLSAHRTDNPSVIPAIPSPASGTRETGAGDTVSYESLRAENTKLHATIRELQDDREFSRQGIEALTSTLTVLQGALENPIREMRMIAIVAGQWSVENADDEAHSMASEEARRASRWADELSGALTASRPATSPAAPSAPSRAPASPAARVTRSPRRETTP